MPSPLTSRPCPYHRPYSPKPTPASGDMIPFVSKHPTTNASKKQQNKINGPCCKKTRHFWRNIRFCNACSMKISSVAYRKSLPCTWNRHPPHRMDASKHLNGYKNDSRRRINVTKWWISLTLYLGMYWRILTAICSWKCRLLIPTLYLNLRIRYGFIHAYSKANSIIQGFPWRISTMCFDRSPVGWRISNWRGMFIKTSRWKTSLWMQINMSILLTWEVRITWTKKLRTTPRLLRMFRLKCLCFSVNVLTWVKISRNISTCHLHMTPGR